MIIPFRSRGTEHDLCTYMKAVKKTAYKHGKNNSFHILMGFQLKDKEIKKTIQLIEWSSGFNTV